MNINYEILMNINCVFPVFWGNFTLLQVAWYIIVLPLIKTATNYVTLLLYVANKWKLLGFVWHVITALLLLWLWGRVSRLSKGTFTQRRSQQKRHIRATAAPLRASVFTLSFFTRGGKGILSLWWIAVGITAVKTLVSFIRCSLLSARQL